MAASTGRGGTAARSGFGKGARAFASALALLAAGMIAGCSTPSVKVVAKKPRESAGKEYFSEAAYGVKASPRVEVSSYDTTTKEVALVPIPKPLGASATATGQSYALAAPAKKLRRGGGREQIGKPYKVAGRWYKPADQPGYTASGKASWYGDAFHGRLTANGEVYDMNNLTAAHPTLPLPSYARVTNLSNGISVIVRINDRGPYAHGRVIDLSKRAAHVLGTKQQGVGEVKVDYIGKAPVDGNDDRFLLASYRPAGTGSRDEDMRLYAGFLGRAMPAQALVMVAAAPVVSLAAPMPQAAFAQGDAFAAPVPADMILPESRPLELGVQLPAPAAMALPVARPDGTVPLGYAPQAGKASPFDAILKQAAADGAPVVIHVATLPATADQQAIWKALKSYGRVSLALEGQGLVVRLETGARKADAVLKGLWASGYRDAFALR